MTILEMANEAELCQCIWVEDVDDETVQSVIRFAKLVAAKEREACANLCNSEKKWWDGMSHAEKDIYQAIDNISACIRARGE